MKTSELVGSHSSPTQTEYQDEKQDKKQKIVRNEFEKCGRYGIPLVKKQDIDISKIDLWSFAKIKEHDPENQHKTIHFFTYDWLFESVYSKPESELEWLDQYYALLTPEFSVWKDMPLMLQGYSTFKNRWCGAYWQKMGMRVIPTIAWGTKESWDFCFEGVEEGSVVAVSTYYSQGNEAGFMEGYNEMLGRIKPSAIICYGEPFKAMKGNIKAISPYDHKLLAQQLGVGEYMKRLDEGTLYPSR